MDPSGLGKLLHIVNHRNMRTDGKTWLSKMELPQITMEMPIAWGGDYVQELAVAGSDAVPTTDAAKAANKALWELVEPFDGFERWLECARRAVRLPNEGLGILADYQDSTGSTNVRDHDYGHAAYTRLNAMLFNTTTIVTPSIIEVPAELRSAKLGCRPEVVALIRVSNAHADPNGQCKKRQEDIKDRPEGSGLVNTPDTERYRVTSTGGSKNMVVTKITMVITSMWLLHKTRFVAPHHHAAECRYHDCQR